MNFEAKIRKLARSVYWQRIYQHSQKNNGIYIFENVNNFSGLQILFLYWLNIYSLLYEELNNKDWINLDEKVIEDDFRCNCFLYWRSKELDKKQLEYKEDMRKNETPKSSLKNPKVKGQSLNIYKGAKGNK